MANLNIITRIKELFGLAPRPIPANLYVEPPRVWPDPPVVLGISPGDTLLIVVNVAGIIKNRKVVDTYLDVLNDKYTRAFPDNRVVVIPGGAGVVIDLAVLRKDGGGHG
jgi:hypothetical protein